MSFLNIFSSFSSFVVTCCRKSDLDSFFSQGESPPLFLGKAGSPCPLFLPGMKNPFAPIVKPQLGPVEFPFVGTTSLRSGSTHVDDRPSFHRVLKTVD